MKSNDETEKYYANSPKPFRIKKVKTTTCGATVFGIILLLMTVLFQPAAWGEVSDLRNRAAIELGEFPTDYVLLELTDEILTQTLPGLPDLRIYSGTEEVPYAVLTDDELSEPLHYEQIVMLNRGLDAEGNFVFELENRKDIWINQIRFLSDSKDFIREIQVEGRHSQRDWTLLVSDSIIFDLTSEQKNRKLEVALPTTNFSYFRITVMRDGIGTFEPDGVETLFLMPDRSAGTLKERFYEITLENDNTGIQTFTFDLGGPFPVSELEIITHTVNFNRNVELQSSEDGKTWTFLRADEFYVYQLDKLRTSQVKLKLRTHKRYLQMKLFNDNNPLLDIEEIKIRGSNPTLVFPVEPEKTYDLYWNSAQIEAPIYDIMKFKYKMDYEDMTRATLGESEENEAFEFVDPRPWTERNAWFLKIILALVVGILLYIIIQSIRKISSGKSG